MNLQTGFDTITKLQTVNYTIKKSYFLNFFRDKFNIIFHNN